MIYNHYLSATNVTLKTYLSPLESLFWNDFMGHIRELQATLKNRQCNNEQTEKTPRQPTLRKIKRGVLPTHLPTQKHHI